MNTKEKFKEFVKQNPILLKYIKEGMTWQKFYEIYDMYGDDENAWKDYIKISKVSETSAFDLLTFIKGIDLDNLKEGVNSVQRVLGLLQDMTGPKKITSEIKPRPLYKHFED